MAKDDLGRNTRREGFEPCFDLGALVGEEAILESGGINGCAGGVGEKSLGRRVRFVAALAGGAEDCPMHVKMYAAFDPAKDGSASTDLDVVGVSANAEN